MKFTDEMKTVKEFSDSNRLPFGVSKVSIGQVELGQTDNGKEFIELTLVNDEGAEDTARVWFTSDKAANYSFNTLRSIYVHNAPEDKKEAAGQTFDSLDSSEACARLFNDKLIGGGCWFTKYVDPERTYTDGSGNVRQSVNKNVLGYEPRLRPELMPKTGNAAVDKAFPGAKQEEAAAAGIPSSW